jgi:hypothetical protein
MALSFGYLLLATNFWFHRLSIWDTASKALRLLP